MDWYRRKTWTKSDEEEFFAKLGRARKDGRAQYLKIQAIELIDTKDLALLKIAESLLNKLLIEYPDNKTEISSAYHSLGNIYKFRMDYDKSMEYYKMSLEYEKVFPNVITQSYMDFSELAVKCEKVDQYEYVENLIESRIVNSFFPIEKYKGYSILSIIKKHQGDIKEAGHFADLANENAKLTTSGLRYHKDLGIVKDRDNWLDRLVKEK
jgi:tetratricopeptide (TPR) repeat protein